MSSCFVNAVSCILGHRDACVLAIYVFMSAVDMQVAAAQTRELWVVLAGRPALKVIGSRTVTLTIASSGSMILVCIIC